MARTPRPEFRPDPSLSHESMTELQREIAASAAFTDQFGFEPADIAIDDAFDLTTGLPEATPESDGSNPDAPVVVGIDQAFLTGETKNEAGDDGAGDDGAGDDGAGDDGTTDHDRAVSAAVAIRDGAVIEYAHAVTPLSIPYVPGLLAFREGAPMLDALDALSVEPDLLVCDGSGRIHFREAGIATHIGVIRDLPSLGVAKRLLCGEPVESVDERPADWQTPIRADNRVETAEPGTVIGHAYQSRQYPNSRRVNPLYVSPGHRVSAETTVDLVAATCAGYKLPEPTRLADAHADRVKRRLPGED
ncbi:deoxyribonuclease V [Halorubrum alkaliphilum]|uniref:Endonuclease V n=1 Tax=Halorubrum alkaliphilum TaxID=261290 RepID=A0A8T4GBA9_9EURY|nr:endonuclease V [Halorubrum alkaliphilum]MBP1921708.1 deoxyribonuclease V [Halorubrum alkaliphilum]